MIREVNESEFKDFIKSLTVCKKDSINTSGTVWKTGVLNFGFAESLNTPVSLTLIKYPFEEVKENLPKLHLENLRTGESRKELLVRLSPFEKNASSWEDAIWAMLDSFFQSKS